MAETLYTRDGRMHTLLGTTTLESIVRDYAGDQAADEVRRVLERNAYEEARAETDLGNYERSLNHWQMTAQDWADEIEVLLHSSRPALRTFLEDLLAQMKKEL